MQHRNWNDSRLASESGLACSTIGRYIRGQVINPKLEVLRAISQFLYKPIKIYKNNDVELDYSVSFDRWQDFAIIGTNEVFGFFKGDDKLMVFNVQTPY